MASKSPPVLASSSCHFKQLQRLDRLRVDLMRLKISLHVSTAIPVPLQTKEQSGAITRNSWAAAKSLRGTNVENGSTIWQVNLENRSK